MAFVWTDYGELWIAKRAFVLPAVAHSLRIRLFTNDYTPIPTDLFDESHPYNEADFPGYVAYTLDGFDVPITVDGVAQTTGNEAVFVASVELVTAQDIFGWYVTDDDGDDYVLGAERLATPPFVFDEPGRTRRISPRFTIRNSTG